MLPVFVGPQFSRHSFVPSLFQDALVDLYGPGDDDLGLRRRGPGAGAPPPPAAGSRRASRRRARPPPPSRRTGTPAGGRGGASSTACPSCRSSSAPPQRRAVRATGPRCAGPGRGALRRASGCPGTGRPRHRRGGGPARNAGELPERPAPRRKGDRGPVHETGRYCQAVRRADHDRAVAMHPAGEARAQPPEGTGTAEEQVDPARRRLTRPTAPKPGPGLQLTPGARGLSCPNARNPYPNAIAPPSVQLIR